MDKGNPDLASNDSAVKPPTISLPKGGGAIRGIGEKFGANPVTGTGSMTVPIATSPGRSGFGPQLALSYDSGSGNGPFGFGWSLSLPSITRKTDKGLPQYQYIDDQDSDVFILSGAEDLVPLCRQDADGSWVASHPGYYRDAEGSWVRDSSGRLIPHEDELDGYHIRRYRPRIEGLFARIERWTKIGDPRNVHWRSISKDNILTVYGLDEDSRIADPQNPQRIFSWLIYETRDDKGNAILYRYKAEDSEGIDLRSAHEANRGKDDDDRPWTSRRSANRYLKHVLYGNRAPLLDKSGKRLRFLDQGQINTQISHAEWMFEVVFDYGEHDDDVPKPNDDQIKDTDGTPKRPWKPRPDPFSTYRPGFEVRTYRLCQRALMFHHFPGEAGVERDCLVRSTEFSHVYSPEPTIASGPVYSFLRSVTQTSYCRNNDGYDRRSLPPVEFQYTEPIVQEFIEDIDAASLENLPIGLDGAAYRWVDLHGEGISGILTEQADAWFYKRNRSPLRNHIEFGPLERVPVKPNLTFAAGRAQVMDLAGDGQPDIVVLDGPVPGFYEHDLVEGWDPFRPFKARLNRNSTDPNLKFIDLDGDGHADVLVTEDNAFVWHASLGEEGFSPARQVAQMLDEEKGPRIVFADGTQSIYLADLSGDGLTDILRIRNGEVCYWPNLGYGRFGPKVTMDNAPCFDHPDQFDQKRIRLADIDGSGTTDIIYLHRDGVRLYFNQSGNSWSQQRILNVFPRVDDLVNIVPLDLLGNGTACLVWSSPLPTDSRRQMRYIDLMGGQKPHLLTKTINNLGAETLVDYAPSTKFYLKDREAGKPWITKLPFPVHCVERVTITDKWRHTKFSTTYTYHHGCFDGEEREFRGFGRVEQIDVEDYGTFKADNGPTPYITDDETLYQPPVKTVTWYHTGAFLDRERILTHFAQEYFPHWLKEQHPNLDISFQENPLPQPDLVAEDLTAEEWREALRACKGMMLRQESIELDIDALKRPKDPEQVPVRLFSTAYHNCHIRRLQPRASNRHAVFLAMESEAMSYHYELDLRPDMEADKKPKLKMNPDPRITHTLNLQFDQYGNVLQSVAAAYPRLGKFEDDGELAKGLADAFSLINQVQREERHLVYTETQYTKDFDVNDLDNYRLRVPCEVMTYELKGISPEDASDKTTTDPLDNLYFSLDELRAFRLSAVHQQSGTPVTDIPYHQIHSGTTPEKRLVEHRRTLYFNENLVDPLPFKEHGRLGLPYETYKLALTETLLDAVFTDVKSGTNKLGDLVDGSVTARDRLQNATFSGYLSGADVTARFGADAVPGQYWIRSGIAGFAPDAKDHFYLPEDYTDPFGNKTTLSYDGKYDLFIQSSTDMLQNKTEVTHFDYRVLAPREIKDMNDNVSEVRFDTLGLPCAMALKGKGAEGDSFTGFTDAALNPSLADLTAFFTADAYSETHPRSWLGNTTARHVYYFGETEEKLDDGRTITRWPMKHPPCACGIVRERHVSQLGPAEPSPIQVACEYSDGLGSVLVKKIQAEPESKGQALCWIASGKTVLNNKGKPVKQYEPYFSKTAHRFDEAEAQLEIGVASIVYYDAPGRVIRTEMPDGSYSRVEFSPWHVQTFDQNDTVGEPDNGWLAKRTASTASAEEKRAAQLALDHAGTPALAILDTLGRDVIAVAHNKVKDSTGVLQAEQYLTFTKLDAEGKPLWIRDARKNLVMQYIMPPVSNDALTDPIDSAPCYDIAGNLLFQHSMDAGDRWMLNDAAGKPMLAWDNRRHLFRTDYDALHRPVGSFVKGTDPKDVNRVIQYEKIIYGETPGNGLTDPQKTEFNLRGKPYEHYDTAGVVISKGRNPVTGTDEAFDFKGNVLRSTRQLVKEYKNTADWSFKPQPGLEDETFTSSTRYDALNRPIQLVAPHSDRTGTTVNVIRHGYNEAILLERVDVWLEQAAEPSGLLNPETTTPTPGIGVENIDYNEKGQRILIDYKNGVRTTYGYDRETFRLSHLYSRRGPAFVEDCENVTPPPKYMAAPNTPPASKPCGVQNLFYAYDPVGNITDIRDGAQQTVFFDNMSVEPSHSYTYDALYRLIKAEGREYAAQNNVQRDHESFKPIIGNPFPNSPEALQRYIEQYDYDSVGNILRLRHQGGSVERWTRRYQYGEASNRLHSTSSSGEKTELPFYSATPGYMAKYTYDPHGNMASMPHLPTMEWDFKDQLHATQRTVGTGNTTYYVYDAGGERVRKITEASSGKRQEERIYFGGFEVYRTFKPDDQALQLERETLHIVDDKHRIALIETRTFLATGITDPAPSQLVRYQFGNHLGSAVLELDEHAKPISYEEYHPYGTTAYEAAASATQTPKRYRYTGKERDEETGFTYHGARYYAPWLGSWVSCDPLFGVDGLHIYEYGLSNPINFVDSDGTQSKPSVFVVSGKVTFADKKKQPIVTPPTLIVKNGENTKSLVLKPKSESMPIRFEDNYTIPENEYVPELGGYLEREQHTGRLNFYDGLTPEMLAVEEAVQDARSSFINRAETISSQVEEHPAAAAVFRATDPFSAQGIVFWTSIIGTAAIGALESMGAVAPDAAAGAEMAASRGTIPRVTSAEMAEALAEAAQEHSTISLFHGGMLEGGEAQAGRALSTTTELEYAEIYANRNGGGQVYRFDIPKSRLQEMEQLGQVQRMQDSLQGTLTSAEEWRFSARFLEQGGAQELNSYLVKHQ